MQPALLAFSAAVVITLLTTPLVRRVALATGLVDHPRDHKSHAIPTPYLGGAAVIAGTLGASVLAGGRATPMGAIALAAAALGVVGLLDDDRTLEPLPRLLAQLGAASVVVAAGVRAEVTGIAAFDVGLTLVWIIGVTNAVNFLDNMDGLAAGVTGAGASAAAVAAALNDQVGVASMAAALAGACLGFLAYNARPARIFMGDAGSLFIGFFLAAVSLEVQPELVGPPASFAVPLLLVAVPAFDIATVIVCRLRRRVSVSTAGRNHLSHRLERRGLSRGRAVGVLVAAEAVAGVQAVLVGAGLLPLLGAVVGVGLVLALLAACTLGADVHPEDVQGFSPRLKAVVGAALGATVALAGPALVALVLTGRDVSAGAEASERALAAARSGDAGLASRHFARASGAFRRAERGLGSPLVRPGLAVPALNANLKAVRTVADVGGDLAADGERLTSAEALTVDAGGVRMDDVRRLAPELAGTATMLREASARMAAADRPYLLGSVRSRTTGLVDLLPEAAAATERAAQVAELAPTMLGGGGTRRYLVVVQDCEDPSPSGGAEVGWVTLVAEAGRLRVERTGPPEQLGPNTPSSRDASRAADFPSFARVVVDRFAASTGQPVDGVAALDAPGLAALLHLTGPASVPALAGPVDAGNVVSLAAADSRTGRAGDSGPPGLLAQVAAQALRRLTTDNLGPPSKVASALGPAVKERHLRLYLTRQAEQAVVDRLGASGRVPVSGPDYLMLATSGLPAGQGGDRLARSARYQVSLDPDGTSVRVRGTLDFTVDDDRNAGQDGSGSSIRVLTPLAVERTALDGRAVNPRLAADADGREYVTGVPVDGRESRNLSADVAGVRPLSVDGSYVLELLPQATPTPASAEVSISVPPGWRVARSVGLQRAGDRRASGRFQLDRAKTISVRIERTGLARLWQRLRGAVR